MEQMPLIDILIIAAIAAVPGLIFAFWSHVKAAALASPAKWDDKVVTAVEDIIKRMRARGEA